MLRPSIAALALMASAAAAQTPLPPAVIPLPRHLELGSGSFTLGPNIAISATPANDSALHALAEYAADLVSEVTGRRPHVGGPGSVRLAIGARNSGPPESYALSVTSRAIDISASTHAGLFYGLQTLAQLLPVNGASIPALTIDDAPRFAYRGMHLDVGRHFFPVPFIKRYIDLLATYKMNTFHWHLTEDQGWRIAISRYPRLTEIGANRAETMVEKNFDPYVGDGVPHGGFYTQEEIRDVVAYAARRYVTIIPEIEMPGHALAALAAYPELACTPGPFNVGTVWGVYDDIFCPKEATFEFIEHVLDEVMDLFPSTYIHIGGDEAPKTRWETSPIAREVMRREGLADTHELQSYFIQRVERHLNAHGRRLIGWDEILEGGLAPQATVMSWRGTDGGIAAARMGHDVIMAPNDQVYFDHYQSEDRAREPLAIGGYTPLGEVYAYEPIPDELSPAEARHILGAQANVWTEYIKTAEHVEYMVLPRMLALSEVVWSPRNGRNWDSFLARLPRHFERLSRLGYNYRVPDVVIWAGRDGKGRERTGGESEVLTLDDSVTVALSAPVASAEIQYTTGNVTTVSEWLRYSRPVELRVDTGAVSLTARLVLPNGKMSAPRSLIIRRPSLRPAEPIPESAVSPGLTYEYFEASVRSVNQLSDVVPTTSGVATDVGFQGMERDEQFGLAFTGFFRAEEDGIFRFTLTSDDGSRFWLANVFLLDNDGPHGTVTRSESVALARGLHPIHIRYFQAGGARSFRLTYSINDGPDREVIGVLYR